MNGTGVWPDAGQAARSALRAGAGTTGTAAVFPRKCVDQYSIRLARERWLDTICRHVSPSSLANIGPRRAT